ncbi:MAG: hypothetical protein J0L97_11135 [Alphaproteobacteria bacterium]|nr:hypothetical protein [Alphaproteobacteria bacterium]
MEPLRAREDGFAGALVPVSGLACSGAVAAVFFYGDWPALRRQLTQTTRRASAATMPND